MKINYIQTIVATIACALFITSCNHEFAQPFTTNYSEDANTDDSTCEYDVAGFKHLTYVFTDDEGNNTVSAALSVND